MPLKDRLRQLRTAADLTQQDLAMKAGLSISSVVQIERGLIPDPRMTTLRALAKALRVSMDELAAEDAPAAGQEERAAESPRRRRGPRKRQ
jgi:transcriptional regulator with XRE-family HTH domain